ncbi:MAG: hypothetical protein R3D27_06260 [Hyphomicrobiaceae bacterium]
MPERRRWLRIGLLLIGYALIMVLGHFGGRWLQSQIDLGAMSSQGAGLQAVLLIGLLVYVVLLALPFVPGIEISLALFAAFGAKVALPVYCATLVALLIAYAAGRFASLRSLAAFFEFIGLASASGLVRRLAPMTPRQRIETLVEAAPSRIAAYLVRYRDLSLIASLNMPGNALIGGGGGIALLAGMSGLFPAGRFALAIALGSMPIPLTMALAGHGLRW